VPSDMQTNSTSKKMHWAGRIVSALPILMLLLDGIMKLRKPDPVVQSFIQLGYSPDLIVGIGIALIVSTILYAIPQTSVLGAILLTGYLGGAVASHLRAGQGPLRMGMPILVAIVVWLGLLLRDSRVRNLIPLRS